MDSVLFKKAVCPLHHYPDLRGVLQKMLFNLANQKNVCSLCHFFFCYNSKDSE